MDKMWPANVIKIIVFCTKLQKKNYKYNIQAESKLKCYFNGYIGASIVKKKQTKSNHEVMTRRS